MDGFEALVAANAAFGRRLRLVTADDWHRPTPCTEWDVRALVNHVVGGNRRHTMLLRGASAAEVDATRTHDHLGDDAAAAFDATARTLVAEFRMPGALTRQVHHPIGDRTGRELLGMRILDVTVHAWDLSCGIDADRALDPTLVQQALLEATGRGDTSGGTETASLPGCDRPPVPRERRNAQLLASKGEEHPQPGARPIADVVRRREPV